MSNIAGKSYAMNVITPIKWWRSYFNQFIFWIITIPPFNKRLDGLLTLSLIHYARWAIVKPWQWPRLSNEQPKEKLKYAYMLFFSNFNGSWDQYVDSFHMAIPSGLDIFWKKNIRYPKSVPLTPFHRYINHNQIWTEHYYNAYPLASSNDVKSSVALKLELNDFIKEYFEYNEETKKYQCKINAEEFKQKYSAFLAASEPHLGIMRPSPVVSIANNALEERQRINAKYKRFEHKEDHS